MRFTNPSPTFPQVYFHLKTIRCSSTYFFRPKEHPTIRAFLFLISKLGIGLHSVAFRTPLFILSSFIILFTSSQFQFLSTIRLHRMRSRQKPTITRIIIITTFMPPLRFKCTANQIIFFRKHPCRRTSLWRRQQFDSILPT